MAFCTKCGTNVADGVKFCTSCGTPMTAPATQQPPQPQAPPQPQQPVYQQPPVHPQPHYQQPQPQYAPQPEVYKEEPISTGGFIGIYLLMLIPIVNLILLIVWACGGCSKRSQANFARASLILMVIGAVLTALVGLAGGLLFGDVFADLIEMSNAYVDF